MDTIAVVEDDVLTGDMVSDILSAEGFQVLRAYSGTEALYLLRQNKVDLVLLDLMLPGLDGEQVLAHIKDIPVIILSSRTDVEDKITLLNEGACDYITKPFSAEELIARILVQLRREKLRREPQDHTLFSVGELSLDILSLELSMPSQSVKLTKTECLILKMLMKHPKYTLPRDSLLDSISYESPDCTERSLKQHIYNLRKKLDQINSPIQIETVRSVGFKLTQRELV